MMKSPPLNCDNCGLPCFPERYDVNEGQNIALRQARMEVQLGTTRRRCEAISAATVKRSFGDQRSATTRCIWSEYCKAYQNGLLDVFRFPALWLLLR